MKLPRLFHPTQERAPLPVDRATTLRIMRAMETHGLVEFAQQYLLTPAHFSTKRDGWSALHMAAFDGDLDQIIEVLQRSGQAFTCADFLKDPGTLRAAKAWHHLDQVFTPSLWACRLGEMEKLSRHVPAEELQKIGYEDLRAQAIQLSIEATQKIPAADFAQARRAADAGPKEEGALLTRSQA